MQNEEIQTAGFGLRAPEERDWRVIAEIANLAVPMDVEGNIEWLRNRRAVDESRMLRRHYTVENGDGQVVAYGTVEEREKPLRFRMFMVQTNATLQTEAGELLFRQLMSDLRRMEANAVWVYEYTHDEMLLAFLRQRGFHEVRRFVNPDNGLEIAIAEMQL